MNILKLAALGLILAGAATPLRADDGVTPTDVKETAEDKRQTIEKNTRDAGKKTKSGAKKAKDAGNNAAYKIQDKKDAAVEKWEKNHATPTPTATAY